MFDTDSQRGTKKETWPKGPIPYAEGTDGAGDAGNVMCPRALLVG